MDKTIIARVLILTFLNWSMKETIATSEQKYYTIHKMKSLTSFSRQYSAMTIHACAAECMSTARTEGCPAAGYHRQTRNCQLGLNTSDIVNVTDVNAVVINESPLTDCGPVPPYPNTVVTYAGGTTEGSIASVECQLGFQMKNNVDTVSMTCQTSGIWDWDTIEPECWKLMFRGTAENGHDPIYAYLYGTGSNGAGSGVTTSDPDCMVVQNNSCTLHYRHLDLDYWSMLGVRKVRYEMYNNGEAVMSITVNGTGSSMTDWLLYQNIGPWRLLEWPWTDDLNISSECYMAVYGWAGIELGQSFRMATTSYSSCQDDYYYTVVLYHSFFGCAYENHSLWPQFLYAKGTSGALFETEAYGLASVMAVWVYHDE